MRLRYQPQAREHQGISAHNRPNAFFTFWKLLDSILPLQQIERGGRPSFGK
jgi:hypothetical protein